MTCIVCKQKKDNISPLTDNINNKICEDCISKKVKENKAKKEKKEKYTMNQVMAMV